LSISALPTTLEIAAPAGFGLQTNLKLGRSACFHGHAIERERSESRRADSHGIRPGRQMCEDKAALGVAACCKGKSAACVLCMNDGTCDGGCGLIHRHAANDAFHGSLRGCMYEGECSAEQNKQHTRATARDGDFLGNS
jgi:hypothetical protein